MKLNSVLRRVRALVATAEHPGTPKEEADSARALADSLMLKYAIEEAQLDQTRPAASRSKPGTIEVDLSGSFDFVGYIGWVAEAVADTCRCKIRLYNRYTEGTWKAMVYGYESDLRYFEVLYTTLRLHMVGALRPSLDTAKSLEDNAYSLRNAGFNWTEMAELEGWRRTDSRPGERKVMYQHQVTGERSSIAHVAGKYKLAYERVVKAKGERIVKISPAATRTFRRSAAQGYASRIGQRLRGLTKQRTDNGKALDLRADSLDEFFREQNPDLFRKTEPAQECEACKKAKSGHCRHHRPRKYVPSPFSEDGYQHGVQHANSASLNPQAGSSQKPAISS